MPAECIRKLSQTYHEIGQSEPLKALLLRLLVVTGDPPAHQSFAQLLVDDPISDPRLLLEVFSDLMQQGCEAARIVLPKMMPALSSPGLATFVLDFANHASRTRCVSTHPAKEQSAHLARVLSSLADRLNQLQEARPDSHEQAVALGRQVNESVSLGVSLCDALGLIGDPAATPALNKTVQVEHRRLRVEAAAALTRVGVEDAGKMLIGMAAEPIERLRVLKYAEELDLHNEIPDEFSAPVARAEAEFVMNLAQPTHFGVAPSHLELVDECELAWPGFEEPQACYLFRFVYDLAEGEYNNIGIAGPLVMSVPADLTSMSYEDIYALFAGWHVQHDDIFCVEPTRVVGREQAEMDRLLLDLQDESLYEDVQVMLWGHFLESRLLIASGRREHENGWVVVSADSYSWIPLGHPERPLGAQDAFFMCVGRGLLATFN